ncbi:phosphatidylethanolamine N-methyltransferase, partial [Cladochytrium tenue]
MDDFSHSERNLPRFELGEPIMIQFTCARETMKQRDWIGIYLVGSNLSREVTTFNTSDNWMFVVGARKVEEADPLAPMMKRMSDDERDAFLKSSPQFIPKESSVDGLSQSSPQYLRFGRTVVTVRMSEEDQGLRVVTGRVVFRGKPLPWETGVYEARYHPDGKYAVAAVSEPFELVAERFAWPEPKGAHKESAGDGDDVDVDGEVLEESDGDEVDGEQNDAMLLVRVREALLNFVERCLDLPDGVGGFSDANVPLLDDAASSPPRL